MRDHIEEIVLMEISRMQREVYKSAGYDPDRVTGWYVRCTGRKPHYIFRVYETATGTTGRFLGAPGMGPTLREYDTDGIELPEELKARCIASKQTERWK